MRSSAQRRCLVRGAFHHRPPANCVFVCVRLCVHAHVFSPPPRATSTMAAPPDLEHDNQTFPYE